MRTVVFGGIIIAMIILVLITALFLKMLLAKDMSHIAIMRSLGLTRKQIEQQYRTGTMLVFLLGIIVGVVAANILGEFLVSMAMMSFMGAAKIEFVHVIWQTWLLCSLVLLIIVGYTISVCCHTSKKICLPY